MAADAAALIDDERVPQGPGPPVVGSGVSRAGPNGSQRLVPGSNPPLTPWLMASLLYGAGLRVLECARLRVKDVDFDRREIVVRDGKGLKDR